MPTDTTPDPRDMERLPEAQAIPDRVPGRPRPVAGRPDIAHRPSLPDRPRDMPADHVQDETAAPDPDTGVGRSDGNLNRA